MNIYRALVHTPCLGTNTSASIVKLQGEHELTRAMVWRIWFGEWVRAARYLSVRKLLLPKLVIEKFSDEAGRIHDRLYEALFLKGQVFVWAGRME